MKAQQFELKFTTKIILSLQMLLLLTSCGTYLSVYDNDGIYSTKKYEEVKEEVEQTPRVIVVDQEQYRDYDENYFARKLEDLERIQENEIFTDVETYASESEFEDTNYNQREPWGYEDNDVVVSLNLWNDPFWGAGFNNWGWGFNNWGWGFADPWFYGNFSPFWRNQFYGPGRIWARGPWGLGFNNWGWGFNSPWFWNGGFVNPYWGNRFWNNNFYQNNRWARSNPYRLNRNNNRFTNSRYSNRTGRRTSSITNNSRFRNSRFSNSSNGRTGNASSRRNSVIRRGTGTTNRNSTVRRGSSSSRYRASSRSSSSRRGTINRSSTTTSRSSGARSSSRSSSRSSGSRGSSSSRGRGRGGN